MFVRQRQILATAIFVLDGLLIASAWLAAYQLRFHTLGLPAPQGIPSLSFHLWVGAVITPWAGQWIDRVGHRFTLVAAFTGGATGVALTLVHSLPVVMVGTPVELVLPS